MPTDPSTEPVPAITRRSFFTRTLAAGAVASAVAVAGPARGFLPLAGAQSAPEKDVDYAAALLPLELAAVGIYQAALGGAGTPALDEAWVERLRGYQALHNQTVSLLQGYADTENAPVVDAELQSSVAAQVGGDLIATLTALAAFEERLSATHLQAVASVADVITAKQATQIAAVEGELAVLLAAGAGAGADTLVTSPATTDAASAAVPTAPETTDTTAADN